MAWLWKNQYKKKEHKQHSSLFKLSYYLNVKDSLIIAVIFIFLFCCEKSHGNKNAVMKIQNLVVNPKSPCMNFLMYIKGLQLKEAKKMKVGFSIKYPSTNFIQSEVCILITMIEMQIYNIDLWYILINISRSQWRNDLVVEQWPSFVRSWVPNPGVPGSKF